MVRDDGGVITMDQNKNAHPGGEGREWAEETSGDDFTISLTVGKDIDGKVKQRLNLPWSKVPDLLLEAGTQPSKRDCPVIKLATFGDQRTAKGSLRSDANLLMVTGIEGDYDQGQITPQAAKELLEAHQIRALIYPSYSHTPEHPRFRILAPLAKPVSPSERLRLAEALNGIMGGELDPHSGTLSQDYFFGWPPGTEPEILTTFDDPDDGFCLDHIDHLDELRRPFGKTSQATEESDSGARREDAYLLAALRRGENINGNSTTLVARLVYRGIDDEVIRLAFAGLVPDMVRARGQERVDQLFSGELDRMIAGAKAKFAPPPPVDNPWSCGGQGEGEAGVPSPPRFSEVSLSDVFERPEPQHPFIWAGRIPAFAHTILSADGGKGKSGGLLQLAGCVALGTDYLGQPTLQRRAAFFSGEDHGSVIRQRFGILCRNMGWDPRAVAENLKVLDATEGALLFEQNTRTGRATPTWQFQALREYVEREEIGFLVIDNSSDTFGANSWDKTHVTQFVRALTALVTAQAGAVVTLAHVNKEVAKGIRTGQDYTDSVAWNNASRSRLFLREDANLADILVMEHQKSNYAPKAGDLRIERMEQIGWRLADSSNPEFAAGQAFIMATRQRVLLTLLAEFYARGDWVSPSANSPGTNPYSLFHREPGFPSTLKKSETMLLFREMERAGFIEREVYRKPSRHPGERWAITAKGREFAGLPPEAASPAEDDDPGHSAPGAPGAPGSDFSELGAVVAQTGRKRQVRARANLGGMGERARTHRATNPAHPTTHPQ